MSALFLEYKRNAKKGMTFSNYLAQIGFGDPSVSMNGMDDKVLAQRSGSGGLELIAVPGQQVTGVAHVIVLLVDFPDRPGTYDPGHYKDLFFSKGLHPTGSVRDYYAEVSNGHVDVVGTVHGWLRMPKPYTDYIGSDSGMKASDYPENAQRLAEDAAQAAVAAGVQFSAQLDLLGRNFVTAFVVVHSGMAAELFQSVPEQRKHIWSHKWNIPNPVRVGPGLDVTTYLTVAQNCKLGVCAHELGHLLFQWQDFYDPNYDEDGELWRGSGNWDLMANGSYNFGSAIPAHPAGLHKSQHGWVEEMRIKKTTSGVRLLPTTVPGGRVCKISSPAYAASQFLLLESRPRRGFDKYLPGEGLLVWRVDLAKEMYAPATPGMQLVQADGEQLLESPDSSSQGDDSDPFPGSANVKRLTDAAREPSTSFPGRRSGIEIKNISVDGNGVATFDVVVSAAVPLKAAVQAAPAASKRSPRKFLPKPPLGSHSAEVPSGAAEGAESLKTKVAQAPSTPLAAKAETAKVSERKRKTAKGAAAKTARKAQ